MWKTRTAAALLLTLVVVCLAGCGGTSAADTAVCDAYQGLVDSWPADSEAVQAAGSAAEIFGAITAAGEALVAASRSADSEELAAAGEVTGNAAATFAGRNANLVSQGFIPFFSENLVAGEELSRLCEEIGRPITLP